MIRKFSKDFIGCLLSRLYCFVFSLKPSKVLAVAIFIYVCLPLSALMLRNAWKSRCIIFHQAPILVVLGFGTNAKIFPPIVEGIAVYMIDNFSVFRFHDDAMHQRTSAMHSDVKTISPATPFLFPRKATKQIVVTFADFRHTIVNQFDVLHTNSVVQSNVGSNIGTF